MKDPEPVSLRPPFIVAEATADTYTIDVIVRDIAYLNDFEPIDVVNGATTVWDAEGNMIMYAASRSSVERGTFDFENGEPQMIVTPFGNHQALLAALQAYIAEYAATAHRSQMGTHPSLRDLLHLAKKNGLILERP